MNPDKNIPDNKIFIILPVFNEEQVIQDVIDEIQKTGYQNIITVDDGSDDQTFQITASLPEVIALRHKLNRGKGAATKTGIEAAVKLGAEVIVTMDSDGQHDPKDIEAITRPIIEKQADVVLGSRLKNRQKMPPFKKACNLAGNCVTWSISGLWVTDSQSGFRAYSLDAVNIIDTRVDRYEYESEIIREIYHKKLSFKEVPIEVRYTDYSMNKLQKQNIANGIKTVYKLIWNIIR